MALNHSNIAVATDLNGGITAVATSLVVTAATGYPAVPFVIQITDQTDPTTYEVVLVEAKSGTTFSSLTRSYGGTTAQAWVDADLVSHVVIAEDVDGWADWIAVSGGIGFANSWVNYAAGYNDAEYRKHSDGSVQVRGMVKSGTAGSVAFTLPSGYRPPKHQYYAGTRDSVPDELLVGSDGTFTLTGTASTFWGFHVQFDSTGGS